MEDSLYAQYTEVKRGAIQKTELYGFIYFLITTAILILYLLWAFVPLEVQHLVGIYYQPQQHYAIAIPLWIQVSLLFMLAFYQGINSYLTHPLDSYYTLQDHASLLRTPQNSFNDEGVEKIEDIQELPLTVVNSVIYS